MVVEPRESRVIKPLGTLVQLNCSATQEAMTIFWNVLIPNEGQPLNSAIPEVLLPLNIMVVGNSRLVINGTEQNNGSVYTCVVIIEGSNQCSSTSIEVVFYGIQLRSKVGCKIFILLYVLACRISLGACYPNHC